MKHILFLISFVGLAIAQQSCSQRTVTRTLVSIVYVTSSPIPHTFHSGEAMNSTLRYPHTPSAISSVSSSARPTEETTSLPRYGESVVIPPQSASFVPDSMALPGGKRQAKNTGKATFYGGNVAGGMCSFNGGFRIPSGIFGTALSDANWLGAQNCGACLSVTGPKGNSIKVIVVDQCPGCGTNHLDLFSDAFAKLADPSKGIIDVSWSIVSCGITSPIILKNKEGTSQYWFSMQVMNSNVPVSKLEVSIDGGRTWKGTNRQPYNYFENSSGFGTQTVDVRVTSVNGGTIVVKGVSVAANSQKTASGNFP